MYLLNAIAFATVGIIIFATFAFWVIMKIGDDK